MARVLGIVLGILVLTLAGYLLFWPVAIDPGAWTPPEDPGFEGRFFENEALADLERIGQGLGPAPEDVAHDAEGRIYGGCANGVIWRTAPDGTGGEVFADTGGRPLGMHFDREGNLIVADSYKGLLSIDPEGEITTLCIESDGIPFKFADDVDIAADGTIYFSDASFRFGQEHYIEDIVEHQPNGRFLAYDPDSGEVDTVLDDLYFANGIAVDPEQRFVLIVETGKYWVRRYWLEGNRAGETDIIIENLPGFPDGISAGSDGIFWLAVAAPRNTMLDALMPSPFLRKVMMRLPESLKPKAEPYACVLGIDGEGNVVHNLQDPSGAYAPITSAQEHDGHLYFGSIEMPSAARAEVPTGPPTE